jgi:hypothetical protein
VLKGARAAGVDVVCDEPPAPAVCVAAPDPGLSNFQTKHKTWTQTSLHQKLNVEMARLSTAWANEASLWAKTLDPLTPEIEVL